MINRLGKKIAETLQMTLRRQGQFLFHDFYYFQYSEFLDSVLTKGANIFKSFDFKLEGDFSFPRHTINFFHFEKSFLIGGLVPMTFGK